QLFTADFFRLLPRSGMKQHHPAVTELALFAEADVAWLGWGLNAPIAGKIEPGRRSEKRIGRLGALALRQLRRKGRPLPHLLDLQCAGTNRLRLAIPLEARVARAVEQCAFCFAPWGGFVGASFEGREIFARRFDSRRQNDRQV